MEKKGRVLIFSFLISLSFIIPGTGIAHFGMVIPSDDMVMKGENTEISVRLLFWHPFEGTGMELERPSDFGVISRGKRTKLLDSLKPQKVKGHTVWDASYRIKGPGVYVFYMEPKPYWEPAEDCYIIHYTKTYVAAFGDEEGWDRPLGLKAEIIPLTRPFGLYAGNVFQGTFLLDGKPLPNAEVEVEYFNEEGKYKAPTEYMIAQTLRTDSKGVFTFAVPKEGWWGFAALTKDTKKIKGKEVELGAVIWVRFYEMK